MREAVEVADRLPPREGLGGGLGGGIDFVAVFGVDAEDGEGGGDDGGAEDEAEETEGFEATEDADEEENIVELGAIAE